MKAKRETGTSFWEAGKKSGEKVMRKEKMNFRRMIVYLLGLAIMAAGSNLFLKADLGVVPSCTAALLLTRLFPATAGGYALFNFIVNFCFLCAEIAVEGKMEKRYPVQFLLIFFYSLFIRWTSLLFESIVPEGVFARVVLCMAACLVLGAGISLTVNSGLAVLPVEGFVLSVAQKCGARFGTVRVETEVSVTVLYGVLSVLFIHNMSVIGIGTVIAALFTGTITNWFTAVFSRIKLA